MIVEVERERELWPEGDFDSILWQERLIKIVYLPISGKAFILRIHYRQKDCVNPFRENMAFYIQLNKVSETEDWADYEFWESENDVGKLRLDRKAGKVAELREIKAANAEVVFTRASWKVLQHFLANECPEKTCWES